MITVPSLLSQLTSSLPYPYYVRLAILVHRPPVLKARLYIKHDVFIHYRNDAFNSTSFTLIIAGKRIYARDQVRGKWHRHPKDNPDSHDYGEGGSIPVNFNEFLEEVDQILSELDII
jgi:hypothetical protein